MTCHYQSIYKRDIFNIADQFATGRYPSVWLIRPSAGLKVVATTVQRLPRASRVGINLIWTQQVEKEHRNNFTAAPRLHTSDCCAARSPTVTRYFASGLNTAERVELGLGGRIRLILTGAL